MINSPTPTPERKCVHIEALEKSGITPPEGYTCRACHPSTPESRLDSLIDECISIRGDKVYDGSYAAPREAFREVLRKAVSQEQERLLGEVEGLLSCHEEDVACDYGDHIRKEDVLALLKSKN